MLAKSYLKWGTETTKYEEGVVVVVVSKDGSHVGIFFIKNIYLKKIKIRSCVGSNHGPTG